MLWKRGWILDSLNYRVEKELQDTLYKNETFLRFRWSWLERLIIWGSKNVFLASFILLANALIVSFLISSNYDYIRHILPSTSSGMKPLIEIQSTLFGAQITILGLIFPLVIAFIGVLLQGKSSNKSMWVVYRHNSGFMLVGFSALTLASFFVLLKLFQSWLTYHFIVASAISITIWFSINLFLSGWFLWKTVQFLSLDERMEMVVKYAINEVIIFDIRRRLLSHLCLGATKTGLLPEGKNDIYEITTYSAKELPQQLVINHSKPMSVSNVWYRFFRIGVWVWTIQVRFSKHANITPTLSISFNPEDVKRKAITIAKTNIGSINFISAFFMRMSMRYSSGKNTNTLDLEQMVGAMYGQVEDALKENNPRLFDSAKKELEHFQKEIESSMQFINDNGEPDNWILLPEGRWFGKSFLDVFMSESSNIAKSVTRRIHDDMSFFESWCYLYLKIFSADSIDKPQKIGESYIDGHYFIWGSLMSWMGGSYSEKPLDQTLDRVLKHYIGSWEQWPNIIDNEFIDVKKVSFDIALSHLNNTSCMIIYATKYENFYAAKWATDMLIYWYELFSGHRNNYHHYGWHHELLTPNLLKCEQGDNILTAAFKNGEPELEEATSIALRNYWLDLRCLTAAYLMCSPQYKDIKKYKEYVNALLNSVRLESSGSIELTHAPIKDVNNLLGIFLRQKGCWEHQQSYTASLEHHLRRLSRIEEPDWVSGRIYSSRGRTSELYLPNFFKVVGIGYSSTAFKLDRNWSDFLKSDAISQRDLENTISSLKTLTVEDNSELDNVCYQFNVEMEEAIKRQIIFVKSVKDIITDLESKIAAQIISTPIDHQRLVDFGMSATGGAFNITHGPIPISLFYDVDYSDDFSSALTETNITNYRKSEVAEGLDVNRAINESEWLSETIAPRVSAEAFRQLFQKVEWVECEFIDVLTLINQAVIDSRLIVDDGCSPIMFIGPWNLYRRIDTAKWHYAKEEEKLPFDIEVETGKPSSYICHLGGIEMHRLPFSKEKSSILLPKEAFNKIVVKRFGDGRYVNVDFNSQAETDLTGTLTLAFGIDCQYSSMRSFMYISQDSDDD
ncbi:MAG: hypothetical protein V5789_11855 [Colwellia sp.]